MSALVKNLPQSILPLFAGGENCENGHTYGPAVRSYYILHYIVSGQGQYTVNGITYELTEGQAFLIKPGEVTVYKADDTNPWSYIWVAWETSLEPFKNLSHTTKSPELISIMRNYSDAEKIQNLNDHHAVALIWSVIAVISESKYSTSKIGDYTNRAIKIIEQKYSGDISVKHIADSLNIDRSYFSNLFKNEVGISPQQYIINTRLKRALELLNENKYTISVIATSVGFGDQFTFSRCFKKRFGVPPTKYKDIR